MGQLTNTRWSDGAPDPDGALKEVVRIKIRHYRNVYLNHPDPIVVIPLTVDTSGHLYDEFWRIDSSLVLLTVKRLCLMSCQRNRTSFVSLNLRVLLIWRVLLVWLCRKHRLGGLQSPWTSHLGLLYHTTSSFHSFVWSHTTSISFPRTFSSTFCLSGTCWVFILVFHWFLCSS